MLLTDVIQGQSPPDSLPYLLVGVITAIAVPAASVVVALIYRRGDKRTEKGDAIPDLISLYRERIADLEARYETAIEDRNYWRSLAWRQINNESDKTGDAFTKAEADQVKVRP